jgi:hypothetical protein
MTKGTLFGMILGFVGGMIVATLEIVVAREISMALHGMLIGLLGVPCAFQTFGMMMDWRKPCKYIIFEMVEVPNWLL